MVAMPEQQTRTQGQTQGRRGSVSEETTPYAAPRFGMVPEQVLYDTRLRHTSVRVYAALALHADERGRCFPSQGTLSEVMGMSRQTVSSAIHQLVTLGYLLKVNQKRDKDGGNSSCLYRLTAHPLSKFQTPPVQNLDTPLSNSKTPPCPKFGHQEHTHKEHTILQHTQRTPKREIAATPATTTEVVAVTRATAPSADAEARPLPVAVSAKKPAPAPTTPKPAPVNPLWDALMEIFNPSGEPMTRTERSNYGRVVRNLKEVGATPEEVRLRADRFRAKYGQDYLTINALDSNWTKLAQEQKGTGANDAAAERRARERREAEREADDERRAQEAQLTKAAVAQLLGRAQAE